MKHPSNRTILRIKIAVFCLCLIPLVRLVTAGFTDGLGADPIETVTRSTGIWTLNFLFITLAVTPVRRWTGWQWLARLRRTVALYCFFYACLHFLTYLVFDQFFDWPGMAKDIAKRPFILIGFASFVLLIPLAVTSTNGMIRRLGGRRWQQLHRLVYLIAAGGVFHYLWLVKRDITGPVWYAVILCVLLCARIVKKIRPRTEPLPKPGVRTLTGIGSG